MNIKLRIILFQLLRFLRIDSQLLIGSSIAHIQGDAFLDVDLEPGLSFFNRFHVVPDFALQAYVRHHAISGFRVDSRHVAGIGIPIGIAILNIEEHNKIVAIGNRVAHDHASKFETALLCFLLVVFLVARLLLLVIAQQKAALIDKRKPLRERRLLHLHKLAERLFQMNPKPRFIARNL